jgi:hypothetical protein
MDGWKDGLMNEWNMDGWMDEKWMEARWRDDGWRKDENGWDFWIEDGY